MPSKYDYKPFGSGVLMRNQYFKNDPQPEYTGFIEDMDGNRYELAAWVKEGDKGRFFSIRMQTKTLKDEAAQTANTTPVGDDDVPF